eukprot:TRINITY_DN28809_c0_g1_i1.p1 TRINITY_DN28809_c0_g1~~TRINITY_DN28809_c0_g1_i1.p1  ORF type:complete len:309 (-),score=47.40 TRINITY_DN28809_c0_g1_i1:324-1250(-)
MMAIQCQPKRAAPRPARSDLLEESAGTESEKIRQDETARKQDRLRRHTQQEMLHTAAWPATVDDLLSLRAKFMGRSNPKRYCGLAMLCTVLGNAAVRLSPTHVFFYLVFIQLSALVFFFNTAMEEWDDMVWEWEDYKKKHELRALGAKYLLEKAKRRLRKKAQRTLSKIPARPYLAVVVLLSTPLHVMGRLATLAGYLGLLAHLLNWIRSFNPHSGIMNFIYGIIDADEATPEAAAEAEDASEPSATPVSPPLVPARGANAPIISISSEGSAPVALRHSLPPAPLRTHRARPARRGHFEYGFEPTQYY